MKEVYIIAAKRTAVGSFLGSLSKIKATELASFVLKDLLNSSKINKDDIKSAILGHVLSAGAGMNSAKQVVFSSINKLATAYTINHVCGSGLKSVSLGFQEILLGLNDIVITGGMESMSNAPHFFSARNGKKMGNLEIKDSLLNDGLVCSLENIHMGNTAENIVDEYNITRKEQDEFSYNSHKKAKIAEEKGYFNEEITPINLSNTIFKKDEGIRDSINIETLTNLKAVFKKDGSVTAGNSSTLNDGASIIILASKKYVEKNNLKPLAKIVSFGSTGVEPKMMGLGAAYAAKKAIKSANISLNEIDLIESNEAFAAQAIAVNKIMEWDVNKVNISGGAISIGHPIGASGARILTTLLYNLKREKLKRGLATLCIGGGQGISICIERDSH